jgi:hypothetical protein
MVEERADGVLRPDAAIFEVIGKPWRTNPWRGFKIALRPENSAQYRGAVIAVSNSVGQVLGSL